MSYGRLKREGTSKPKLVTVNKRIISSEWYYLQCLVGLRWFFISLDWKLSDSPLLDIHLNLFISFSSCFLCNILTIVCFSDWLHWQNCKYGKYVFFFILRCSSSGNVLPSLVLWLAFYVTAHQLFRQDFTDRLRGRLKQIASNPEQQIYLKLRPFFFLVFLNTGQIIDIINNSEFKL